MANRSVSWPRLGDLGLHPAGIDANAAGGDRQCRPSTLNAPDHDLGGAHQLPDLDDRRAAERAVTGRCSCSKARTRSSRLMTPGSAAAARRPRAPPRPRPATDTAARPWRSRTEPPAGAQLRRRTAVEAGPASAPAMAALRRTPSDKRGGFVAWVRDFRSRRRRGTGAGAVNLDLHQATFTPARGAALVHLHVSLEIELRQRAPDRGSVEAAQRRGRRLRALHRTATRADRSRRCPRRTRTMRARPGIGRPDERAAARSAPRVRSGIGSTWITRRSSADMLATVQSAAYSPARVVVRLYASPSRRRKLSTAESGASPIVPSRRPERSASSRRTRAGRAALRRSPGAGWRRGRGRSEVRLRSSSPMSSGTPASALISSRDAGPRLARGGYPGRRTRRAAWAASVRPGSRSAGCRSSNGSWPRCAPFRHHDLRGRLAAPRRMALDIDVVADLFPDHGALGGIYTAIVTSPLRSHAGRGLRHAVPGCAAAAPPRRRSREISSFRGRCAATSRSARSTGELVRRRSGERLERGALAASALPEGVKVVEVGAGDARPHDPDGLLFLNVNTPHDYERARELSETLSKPAA